MSDPDARSDNLQASAAGPVASLLLVAAGLVTIASVLFPKPPGFDGRGVATVGTIGVALGAFVSLLPWRRWPSMASLVLVAPALALITFHNLFGGDDPYRYSIFFIVVFVWLGTFHPRGTSAAVAPLAAVAYLVPLLVRHESAWAIASSGYAIPIFVVLGEIVAWHASRRRALEDELTRRALHDPLTGLPNRALLEDRLAASLARARRRGEALHLLFIDVDEFKSVNDAWGHATGDRVLVAVADAIRRGVRAGDTAARLAGDEFVAIVECDDVVTARQVADRIRDILDTDPELPIPVTLSIGVASTADAASPEELLAAADTALYAAKAERRSCTPAHNGYPGSHTAANSVHATWTPSRRSPTPSHR